MTWISYSWLENPSGPSRLRYHTTRRTTVGRTPLDGWSARRTDPYLTTPNTHKRKITIPPEGFEPAIPASERLQTYAFSRAATGIGSDLNYLALTRYPCYKYSQQPVSLVLERMIISMNVLPILAAASLFISLLERIITTRLPPKNAITCQTICLSLISNVYNLRSLQQALYFVWCKCRGEHNEAAEIDTHTLLKNVHCIS